MAKKFDSLYLHCSASDFGTSLMIRDWHVKRQWRTIGYHEVIQNGYPTAAWSNAKIMVPHLEGAVEIGRPIDCDKIFEDFEMGAHVKGHNTGSYGVCMIGNRHFSNKVLNTALTVFRYRMTQLDLEIENVFGHYEKDSGKDCPNIDMDEFRNKLSTGKCYGNVTISTPNLVDEVSTSEPQVTEPVVRKEFSLLTFSKLFSFLRRARRGG